MASYLMGIDIGTTGAHAMLFDLEGNALGSGYREYASVFPAEHQVEQEAELLVESVFEVCRQTVSQAKVDPKEVLAVSLTSQRATFGLMDADGKILGGRFYVWQDNRALSVLPEIAARIRAEELYQLTGMPLTPTFSLEKLVWIKKHQPERYARTRTIVFPADYLLFRFGAGVLRTEVTCACCSGMIDIRTLDWSGRALDAVGLDRAKLAPLVRPGTVVGKLSREAAGRSGLAEGTLLVTGTGDQQAAALGAGVIESGRASLTLGTAGLLVVGTRQLELEKSPGLMAPSSGLLGLYELEGIQLGAASCFRWTRDLFFHPDLTGENTTPPAVNRYKQMDRLILGSPPGANGLVFLPFLSGAGYPHWDPLASGTFTGLRFSHTHADLMRAVLEGISLESFDMYQQMRKAGVTIASLAVTGGAMESPVWRQTIADVFNMEISPLRVPNATLVGAALFAGIGAGVFRDVAEGVARTVRFEPPVQPIPGNVETYRKRYETYRCLCAALTPKPFAGDARV
ncbi:MAG: FGGY family carbohydrate kinase [Kiritimatiellia bacterium]|jgi:xylulokinase|nr:FGGY family carbohydrate kinase [Kiritimatiellia bacterium]